MASSSGISRGSLTARWRSGRGHCSRRARQSPCRFCVEAEPKPCSKRQLQLADVNTRSSTELLKFSARLSAAVGWCRFLSRPGMPFEPEGRGFNSSRAHHVPATRLPAHGSPWAADACSGRGVRTTSLPCGRSVGRTAIWLTTGRSSPPVRRDVGDRGEPLFHQEVTARAAPMGGS
jgi:hypothetical protein